MATDHQPDDTPAETVTKWLADRTSLAPLIVDAMRALVDYYVFDWRATAEAESHAAEAARAERDQLRADLGASRAEVERLRLRVRIAKCSPGAPCLHETCRRC